MKCDLQELRQEIALAALEVGNNREVARLYSERLGYTVNESTVRGIKKRYLEVTNQYFLCLQTIIMCFVGHRFARGGKMTNIRWRSVLRAGRKISKVKKFHVKRAADPCVTLVK